MSPVGKPKLRIHLGPTAPGRAWDADMPVHVDLVLLRRVDDVVDHGAGVVAHDVLGRCDPIKATASWCAKAELRTLIATEF